MTARPKEEQLMFDMIRATVRSTHSVDMVQWIGKYIDVQVDAMKDQLKRPATNWETTQSLRHTIGAFEKMKSMFCDPEWVAPERPRLAPTEFKGQF